MSSPPFIPKPDKVSQLLKRIVPWLLESNSKDVKYRQNYKGVRGRIGVVGGARDYAGAPYFASISAMRLGADLSYVICSKEASPIIKNYSPDLIVVPLLDCQSDAEFKREMGCLLTRLHALVIGPGLGRDKLLQDRARELIDQAKQRFMPLVLDADSLILVNEDPSLIKNYPNVILTPNRIELQRMLDALYKPAMHDLRSMPTPEITSLVRKCSSDLNVTILAKGMIDIICEGSTQFQLMTDEMTGSNRRCGGQGDILSGLAGVYLHWLKQENTIENEVHNLTAWAAYLAAATTRKCNELTYESLHGATLVSDMTQRVYPALKSLMNPLTGKNVVESVIKNVKYAGSLSLDEISRYTRQMIMEEFGPARQIRLKKSSAVIIGAGGLGCPSAVYLAAGGIGRLGIVDDDRVESSNLHRQILHSVDKVGMLKTESIKQAVLAINPNVEVITQSVKLDRYNAVDILKNYDIVLDATDNLKSRYMISDACVVAQKPLISGAALKMDGQLTVYNYDEDTPCFRCLFPVPPPPNAVGSCSDNGVLGVIPGIIGVHQALEALKIGAGIRPAYAGKMLLFDGQLGMFRHVKLAGRKSDCEACGSNSKLARDLIDYDSFCDIKCDVGQQSNDLLAPEQRVTVEQYREILESGVSHVLVDVRPKEHSDVSRFEHAIQLPLTELCKSPETSYTKMKERIDLEGASEIYVVCRRGIASQRGVIAIKEMLKLDRIERLSVKDIIGGMTAWSKLDPAYKCI